MPALLLWPTTSANLHFLKGSYPFSHCFNGLSRLFVITDLGFQQGCVEDTNSAVTDCHSIQVAFGTAIHSAT